MPLQIPFNKMRKDNKSTKITRDPDEQHIFFIDDIIRITYRPSVLPLNVLGATSEYDENTKLFFIEYGSKNKFLQLWTIPEDCQSRAEPLNFNGHYDKRETPDIKMISLKEYQVPLASYNGTMPDLLGNPNVQIRK